MAATMPNTRDDMASAPLPRLARLGGPWGDGETGGFALLLCANERGGAVPSCALASALPAWAAAELERAVVEAEIARWCPPEADAGPIAPTAAPAPEMERAAVEAEIARWCPPPLDPPAAVAPRRAA